MKNPMRTLKGILIGIKLIVKLPSEYVEERIETKEKRYTKEKNIYAHKLQSKSLSEKK
jgi:hypothetical protein